MAPWQTIAVLNITPRPTPLTFLVHATDDGAVPVQNSLVYFAALKEKKVPAELHIYEKGWHGFRMGTKGTNLYLPQALKRWFQQHGLIDQE